jgi:radical SAM superfamily enzyme YgiQ (UPF0313 family)/SAM-dependent methyltransferase
MRCGGPIGIEEPMSEIKPKQAEALPSANEIWYADHDVRYVSTPPVASTFCGVAHESRYAWAIQKFGFLNKVVLDFGCGSGYGTHLLGTRAAVAHGIDYSSQAITYASHQYARRNTSFFHLDATSAEDVFRVLNPESYDIITSFDVIEHIANYRVYLVNVARLLKGDGTLIIGCPNRLQTLRWNRTWNPFHKQEFGPRQFRELLLDYFDDVILISQDFIDTSKREAARLRNYDNSQSIPTINFENKDIAFVEEPSASELDSCFGLMAVCGKRRPVFLHKDQIKVLLIEPKYAYKEALPWIPIGKGNLASLLRRHGFDVKIIDNALCNLDDNTLLKCIEDYKPDIIGTGGMTIQMSDTLRIAKMVRSSKVGNSLLVGGGVHFTLQPEDGADYFDMMVIGEGETAFLDICNRFRDNNNSRELRLYADIPGICLKMNEALFRTGTRPFMDELDSLPLPAYDLLDVKKYNDFLITGEHAVSIMTGRGCPFDCQFCAAPVLSKRKVRTFSINYTFRVIEYLKEVYDFSNFRIMDDTFASCKDRVFAFCEEIKKRQMKLNLTCLTHVNTADEKMFEAMKDAGFTVVALGIESGNDDILKRINKRITRASAIRAINLAKKAGLIVEGLFMIGNIGETKETIEDTLRFAETYNPIIVEGKRVGFNWFQFATPFPGSKFYADAKEWGTVLSTNLDDYTHQTPVFIPKGLDIATMVQMRTQALQEAGYAMSREELPNLNKAEQEYQKILELVTANRIDEVYKALTQLVENYPEFALAHNDLGVLDFASGSKDTALMHCKLAVKISPNNVNFQKNLADILYLSFGKIVDAVSIYLDIASKNPDDIEVLIALGNASITLEQPANAEKFFERVCQLDPSNSLANRGLSLLRQKEQ